MYNKEVIAKALVNCDQLIINNVGYQVLDYDDSAEELHLLRNFGCDSHDPTEVHEYSLDNLICFEDLRLFKLEPISLTEAPDAQLDLGI
jgi:hypothetical protein